MPKRIEIEGNQYDIAKMSEASKNIVQLLQSVEAQIQEKTNLIALLTKAKKAYISDIKSEMLSKKAGFDFLE